MFRIAINKLFYWLFSRVLTAHRGGLGSIPGRDMSLLGPLKDGDDLVQVSSVISFEQVRAGCGAGGMQRCSPDVCRGALAPRSGLPVRQASEQIIVHVPISR